MSKVIYVDKCHQSNIDKLSELGLEVKIRDDDDWNIQYMASTLTDPALNLVVIDVLDERSIMDIALAAFMCKEILITARTISEFDRVREFATYVEPSATLSLEHTSFINWYKYTFGS